MEKKIEKDAYGSKSGSIRSAGMETIKQEMEKGRGAP
jgi:hypothetical protein